MTEPASGKNPDARRIHVELVSDPACPWCWLGMRYFLSAAHQSPHIIELSWRPYILDPDIPQGGLPFKAYMEKVFGTGAEDKFGPMRDYLEKFGPEAGIHFRFDEMKLRPNTLNAHRLIRWAGGQKLATAMAERIFKAYFSELKNIGDIQVLAALGKDIGLDQALLLKLMAKPDDKDKVMNEIRYFRRLGVAGVPTFIYERQFVLQGAQSAATHLAVMERSLALEKQPS